MGEYDSDVDIEGFEEDDDGKPKTPAPVIVLCNKKKTVIQGSLTWESQSPSPPHNYCVQNENMH